MKNLQQPSLYVLAARSVPSRLCPFLDQLKLKYHCLKESELDSLQGQTALVLIEAADGLSSPLSLQLKALLVAGHAQLIFFLETEPSDLDPELFLHRSVILLESFPPAWLLHLYLQRFARSQAMCELPNTYQILFQQAGVGVAQINSHTGQFVRINEKYSEIIGYSAAEMQHMRFHDISHSEDLPTDLEQMQALLAGQIREFSLEKRLIRKSGEVFWVHLTVTPMWSAGQAPDYHIAIVQDIHQQKLIESRHLEAEERFRQMFEKHDAVMLLINPENGFIIDANAAASRFYGHSRKRLRQMSILNINQKADREVRQEMQKAYFQQQNAFYFDHQLADGNTRTVEVHSTPIVVQGQELLFSIIHDITARRLAEEALQCSEARYRQIVETAEEGIWMLDAQNKTSFVNEKMAQMLGYQSPLEVLGRSVFDLIDEKHFSTTSRNLERRKQGIAENHDFEIVRPDGSRIWTNMATSAILGTEGSYQGALAMVTDISQRKKWEEQLQQNLAERELLLREVHHRVKNNFQVIMSLLNLQCRKALLPAEQLQLQAARERIRTMALVHEELYQTENMARLNLAQYLKHLGRELYGARIEERQIQLKFDLQPVFLSINPSISFALLAHELISNALRHAFPSEWRGEALLQIRLSVTAGYIHMEIEDNGVGFAESLFLSPTDTLGFQLVRQLCQQLDGRLEKKEFSGTHWVFMLPALQVQ